MSNRWRDRKQLNRFAGQHAETYAGAYVDRYDVLRVGFTQHAEAHLAELRARLRDRVELFEIQPVRTLVQMREVRDRVVRDWDALACEGIDVTVVSLLERGNVIEVSVREIDDEIIARLHARYGDAIRTSQDTVEPVSR